MGLYKKILLFHYYSIMKRRTTAKAKPKNGFKKRRTTSKPLARVVPERKYFESIRVGLALIQSTTTWAGAELDPASLNCLFAPVQGDDIFNRQGRRVQVLAIKISGQIGCPPQVAESLPDTATIIRLHLVQDVQTNGIQLNAEDVFGSATAGEPTDMFQNTAFFGKFKVLKSLKFIIQDPNLTFSTSSAGLEVQGKAFIFKMNVKFMKPVVVNFNAVNTSNVASITDNSFHVIGLCSNNQLTPAIAYRCRTTYVDV